jgi:translation initiation factor 6
LITKFSVHKNPFVGLHFKANDALALVPKALGKTHTEAVEKALEVPTHAISISQSDLLGIFMAMNSNGCVVPSFIEDEELAELRKKTGLNIATIDSHSACGNSILCNDHAAVLHPTVDRHEAKKISDVLGVETYTHDLLSKISTVGAINVVTNKGLLAYNEMPEVELKKLERLFKVKGNVGTCNMGVPFVGMGVVANSKGALVGTHSSGYEVQRIYEALFGD